MTIVHITTGLPASGKTTFARTLDAMRFNLDDYRAMLGFPSGSAQWDRQKEKVAVRAMLAGAIAAIRANYDIVMDNTHLVPHLPELYSKEFARFGVTFQVHDFTDVPFAECVRRDADRTVGHVGEDVIIKLFDRHTAAMKHGWRLTDEWINGLHAHVALEPYHGTSGTWPTVIVDIDGTVAIHGDERGHYEYEKVGGDQPNWPILNLVLALSVTHKIVFVSGREDRCIDATKEWLFKHGIQNATILMRKIGDFRPDYIVKHELFNHHIRHKYNVKLVLDDRNQVVQMWREMGLTCLQVADGDF